GDKARQAIVASKRAGISHLEARAGVLANQRGAQAQATAVDLLAGSRELATVPTISFVETINKHLGSVINAVTILAVASMLVWFGLRPAVNGILTPRAAQEQTEAAEAAQLASAAGALALADSAAAELNLVEDLEGK